MQLQNVQKLNKQKLLVAILKVTDENSRIWIRQSEVRYGSATLLPSYVISFLHTFLAFQGFQPSSLPLPLYFPSPYHSYPLKLQLLLPSGIISGNGTYCRKKNSFILNSFLFQPPNHNYPSSTPHVTARIPLLVTHLLYLNL